MTTDGSEAFRKVVEYLSRTAAPHSRNLPITGDTEIYDDLGVYGDDIVELIWWLDKEFGLKAIGINPFKYAAREFPFRAEQRALGRLFGIKPPQYESFKVRDIIAAIEAGRWPDSAV
jgi:hypothetical protein